MNQRIKKLWVDALRSGEYKQGMGQLRQLDFYCCLGVLCDLHSKETGKEWDRKGNVYFYIHKHDFLPMEVQEWAGLHGGSPLHLHWYNDDGKTFDTIADVIEKSQL